MLNTFIEINLNSLKKNLLNIRRKIGNRKILAVIKADAYGHGMIECAAALMETGKKRPDYFGVATVDEAVELRKKTNIKLPVLCLAPFQADDIEEYKKYDITASVSDEAAAERLLKSGLNFKLKIHFNIDTGMGLTGINYNRAFDIIKRLAEKRNITIAGIYTIFAQADKKDKSFSYGQIEKFNALLAELKEKKIEYGIVHAVNSAGFFNLPEAYYDMVRCGSALYGFYPSAEIETNIKIYPVMSIYTKVSVVKKISKGESIGFGRTFIAPRNNTVATVPVGYADGFKRAFSNNFSAIIKGKFYPQAGNVSMDRIAFLVENDKINQGEKVVLLGKAGNKEITLWDWAKKANTIPYEISCSIGKRIQKKFKR